MRVKTIIILAMLPRFENTCHMECNVGGPVGAISADPEKRFLAVGGRDGMIFSYFKVCSQFKLLRAVFKIFGIDTYASQVFSIARNLRNQRANLNSSANDVKWNPIYGAL